MDITPDLVKNYTQKEGRVLPHRDSFFRIQRALESAISGPLDNPRVMILSGLRGVGKTTVLFQLYKEFTERGWSPDDICYISMDKAVFGGKNITDLVEEYQERVLYNYLVKSDRKFIFLIDEAHYSPEWDLEIKIIHDEAPNALFVVSGSSALQLGLSPDLARRSISETLFPLNFLEHLVLDRQMELRSEIADSLWGLIFETSDSKDIEDGYPTVVQPLNDVLRKNNGYSPGAMRKFLLDGGLPGSKPDHVSYNPRYDVIKRVIEADIPLIGDHDTRTLRVVPKILGMLAPAADTSMNSIARDLEGISITSVRRLLDTLIKSRLIFEISPYGGVKRSLRGKTRKYYASPCLASAVLTELGFDRNDHLGPLTECAVASLLFKRSKLEPGIQLTYPAGKGHADLVLRYGNKVIVIEVGYGKKDDGYRQVRKTMKETRSHLGLVVSGSEKVERKGNVIKIPLRHFLCL